MDFAVNMVDILEFESIPLKWCYYDDREASFIVHRKQMAFLAIGQ